MYLLCMSLYDVGTVLLTLQVRLEVIGKKAKNATFISGNEAIKISKEIQKVEKRRIVKSTLCNERSSRSHCLVSILKICLTTSKWKEVHLLSSIHLF